MNKTKIDWCDYTLNVTTGCTKISTGCMNCYAEKMSKRLQAMGLGKYSEGFDKIILHENEIDKIEQYKKGSIVFINSMSDLFHEEIPDSFIIKVLDATFYNSKCIFLILTKRSNRMKDFLKKYNYEHYPLLNNVWFGVSISKNCEKHRLIDICYLGYYKKPFNVFASIEPLLERLDINIFLKLNMLDWVIVGGETGAGARKIEDSWVIEIRDFCKDNLIPFFFKQRNKKGDNILEGIYNEFPEQIMRTKGAK